MDEDCCLQQAEGYGVHIDEGQAIKSARGMPWHQKPVEKKCPRCGKYMVIRGKKLVCSDPECGYSEEKIEDVC